MLTEWYPTPEDPVSGLFVRDQATALGHDHEVELIHVPAKVGEARLSRYLRFRRDARRRFATLHPRGPFDVVHAHNTLPAGWVAVALAQRHGIASVITEHASPYALNEKWPCERIAARRTHARADALIAVSEAQLRDMGSPARCHVVGNPVDPAFHRLPRRPVPEPQSRHFLFVGGFRPQKSVGAILDALALAKPGGWRFVFHGSGPLQAEILRRVSGLPHVTVEPSEGRPGVLRRMEWADVVVAPSRHESFGVAAVEAAVAGRAVIVGRGTATEQILGRSARAVEPRGEDIRAAMFGELPSPSGDLWERHGPEAFRVAMGEVYAQAVDHARHGRRMERATGFEPATSSLGSSRSTN